MPGSSFLLLAAPSWSGLRWLHSVHLLFRQTSMVARQSVDPRWDKGICIWTGWDIKFLPVILRFQAELLCHHRVTHMVYQVRKMIPLLISFLHISFSKGAFHTGCWPWSVWQVYEGLMSPKVLHAPVGDRHAYRSWKYCILVLVMASSSTKHLCVFPTFWKLFKSISFVTLALVLGLCKRLTRGDAEDCVSMDTIKLFHWVK